MYSQFTETFQNSMKPMTELMEINIKTLESLAEQQTSFFTSALSDSLAYTQDITSQSDLASILKVQKEYSEDFQDKFMSASKELYSTMVEAQDKVSAVMKTAFTEAKEMATELTTAATPKAASKSPKSAAK
jgi:phasin family protein